MFLDVIPPLGVPREWRAVVGGVCAAVCVACWLGALLIRPSTTNAGPRYRAAALWMVGFLGGAAAITMLTG